MEGRAISQRNLILSQLICTLELEIGRNLKKKREPHQKQFTLLMQLQVFYPFVRVLGDSYIFLYDIVKCSCGYIYAFMV